jgi:ABC-type multidrug transport system fused ATPase/permease subunit
MLAGLPEGMDTMVGERGVRISGGERKRIALARALVRPISVLVLDEATSELDAQTEEEILESVDKLSKEMIVIVISHRRSIIKHSDRVIIMEDGTAELCGPEEAMEKMNLAT